MISCLIHLLGKKLSLNGLGNLYYFLGIEVISRNDGLVLNQTKCAVDLLDRECMTNCKPISTHL